MGLNQASDQHNGESLDDPLLTQAEAARLLGVSRSTMCRWVKLGLVLSVQLSDGRRRIRTSEVDGWLSD